MSKKTKLELTWIGKEHRPKLEPRILLEDPEMSYHAKHNVTENDLFDNRLIFGDNLLALKALEQDFTGKVKCIYIDPPYNTGKDFVYPDNFQDNIKNYLELTGQTDEGGQKLSSNTDASGRFHTDWLNMMYPRLKLARNLLREDGVIFISIDDGEVANLRQLLDDVFGPENFVGTVIWQKVYAPILQQHCLETVRSL
jgi:adenine-specific DNA-methyltransferase